MNMTKGKWNLNWELESNDIQKHMMGTGMINMVSSQNLHFSLGESKDFKIIWEVGIGKVNGK